MIKNWWIEIEIVQYSTISTDSVAWESECSYALLYSSSLVSLPAEKNPNDTVRYPWSMVATFLEPI